MSQLGVVVVVQVSFRYCPAAQLAVHDKHWVAVPGVGWYVPAPHVVHCRSALLTHCAVVYVPAAHCDEHDMHADDPGCDWNVPALHPLHAVTSLVPNLYVPGAHAPHMGAVVLLQVVPAMA